MDFRPTLSHDSESPIYRQLAEQIGSRIRSGQLGRGERLPATRELAGLMGLNRTTISAAYAMLEEQGLIAGQVGRGSFVTGGSEAPPAGVNWTALLPSAGAGAGFGREEIGVVMSPPSSELVPVGGF